MLLFHSHVVQSVAQAVFLFSFNRVLQYVAHLSLAPYLF